MSEKDKKEFQQEEEHNEETITEQQENTAPEGAGEEPSDDAVKENERSLQDQYNELKDKYLRLFAEFDNYKKRTIREKMDLMRTASQDIMTALLPVLDDFDRAKKSADENDKGKLFEEGVGLVYHKLYSILKQRGLEPMETDGQPFDPEYHEAFTKIPAPSEEMKGQVVDTIEKGYTLNDKIIRHAKVVVGE